QFGRTQRDLPGDEPAAGGGHRVEAGRLARAHDADPANREGVQEASDPARRVGVYRHRAGAMITDPGPIDADTALERVCGFSNTAAGFKRHWIPAFAGMTILRIRASRSFVMPNRQSQARAGAPSRLSSAAAIVRQAS